MSAPPLKSMDAYLSDLPAGLDSYPDHRQRGSILRQFLEGRSAAELARRLPPTLGELVLNPPPLSSWLPEAHATAVYLAIRDLYSKSDDDFVEHCYQGNRRLLSGPTWRIMFLVVTPESLLRGGNARWAKMHDKVELRVEPKDEPGKVELELRFPRALVPPLMSRVHGSGFRAAVEVAGGKDVAFALSSSGETASRLVGTWR